MKTSLAITVLLLISGAAIAAAPFDLPAALHVPSGFEVTQGHYVQFDKATFEHPVAGKTQQTEIEGHVWQFFLVSKERPIAQPPATAARIADALEHDGWTIERRDVLVARKGDTWLTGYGNSDSYRVKVAERAPMSRGMILAPPAKIATPTANDADFPWLSHFPGAHLKSTQAADRPIDITPHGSKEVTFTGPTIAKYYDLPPDVSSYEFVNAYRGALSAAGWTIVHDAVGGDGLVIAHYAKDERDLWLYTHLGGTTQLVRVADMGADTDAAAMKRALDTAGHVAVYGIYFDSDSATPKETSAVTLQHILQYLTANATVRLAIEGHTDSSGAAAHNQQLSDARAASVRSWLLSHGIAAARLESHGYGATKPIADNTTPEGRSKNRRVELVALH